MSVIQISAYITESTKEKVESYVKRRGVKKAFLIEEALLHHLQVLREIPEDVIVPSRIQISEQSMQQLADQLETPAQANDALRALMND